MTPAKARHRPGSPATSLPGLVVGGTGSGCGKTSFTLALLCALRQRGLLVRTGKAGPDYIDTAFHAALSGQPAANLDTWMCRASAPGAKAANRPHGTALPPGLRRIAARMTVPDPATGRMPDMLLVEGAMGLHDGGARGAGSTALLACLTELPVLLVLHAGGMGQSAAAVAEGFLRHRPAWLPARKPLRFLGLVCTHVGSQRHARMLQEALLPLKKELPLLGLMPREGAPELRSRHLGLVEAREALDSMHARQLAQWAEDNFRTDALLRLLRVPPARPAAAQTVYPQHDSGPVAHFFCPAPACPQSAPVRTRSRRPLVGMAWDAAFSFCYADLPALLHELGAEVRTFSPLRDCAPPVGCRGLYFPGGYPELHAQRLEDNVRMREALREMAQQGLPVYGECGGYMYLGRSLRTQEGTHAMSGLLPFACALDDRKAALGYRAAQPLPGWPDAHSRPFWLRGHEFHYARETGEPAPAHCKPLWRLYDSAGTFLREEGLRHGSVAGSWLHAYPEGARPFWRAWLRSLKA